MIIYGFEHYLVIIFNVLLAIFGVWGLFNFETFKAFYIEFCDKQNPYNIQYDKGAYMDFVLKGVLIMSILMGVVIVSGAISNLFF